MTDPAPEQFGLEAAIAEGAAALGVPLAAEAAAACARLVGLLLRWNARINLVAPCSPLEAVDRHVHDALALLRLLDRPEVRERARHWLDVGAGAGLPSLVLAAARPDLAFTTLEPVGKKVAFTREAAAALGLANLTPVQGRLEAWPGPAPAGALSRATFAPEAWAEAGLGLVRPGGLVLVTLGREVPASIRDRAWRLDALQLPRSGAARTNALLVRGGPGID